MGSGGGIFPGDRYAGVSVDGRLDILEWFNQPPTSPPDQPDQSVNVADLSVSTGGFSEVGAIDAKDIFRGYDLRHTQFLVPPNAVLVFTVTAAVTLSTGSDSGAGGNRFRQRRISGGRPRGARRHHHVTASAAASLDARIGVSCQGLDGSSAKCLVERCDAIRLESSRVRGDASR